MVAAIVGYFAVASAAAAAFMPPVDLAVTADFPKPQVAIDANGDAIAVWWAPGSSGFRAQFRRLPGSGPPGPVHNLSPAVTGFSGSLRIATTPHGRSLAVWSDSASGLEARTIGPRGALGPVMDITSPGRRGGFADLATAANGDSVVAWAVDRLDRDLQIRGRTIAADGTLGPIRNLSEPDVYEGPRVAIDADGDAIATWNRSGQVEARAIPPAGALGPVVSISEPTRAGLDPDVVTDADGDSVVAWESTGGGSIAEVRTIASSGNLGPIQQLGPMDHAWAVGPKLATTPDGHAIAVWREPPGSLSRASARRISPTGLLGPVRPISQASGDVITLDVATDASGDSVVAWELQPPGSTNLRLQARAIPAAGPLRPLEQVSPLGVGPGGAPADHPFPEDGALAATASHAVAVWGRHSSHTESIVQASQGP
jgi:hypothetical protein